MTDTVNAEPAPDDDLGVTAQPRVASTPHRNNRVQELIDRNGVIHTFPAHYPSGVINVEDIDPDIIRRFLLNIQLEYAHGLSTIVVTPESYNPTTITIRRADPFAPFTPRNPELEVIFSRPVETELLFSYPAWVDVEPVTHGSLTAGGDLTTENVQAVPPHSAVFYGVDPARWADEAIDTERYSLDTINPGLNVQVEDSAPTPIYTGNIVGMPADITFVDGVNPAPSLNVPSLEIPSGDTQGISSSFLKTKIDPTSYFTSNVRRVLPMVVEGSFTSLQMVTYEGVTYDKVVIVFLSDSGEGIVLSDYAKGMHRSVLGEVSSYIRTNCIRGFHYELEGLTYSGGPISINPSCVVGGEFQQQFTQGPIARVNITSEINEEDYVVELLKATSGSSGVFDPSKKSFKEGLVNLVSVLEVARVTPNTLFRFVMKDNSKYDLDDVLKPLLPVALRGVFLGAPKNVAPPQGISSYAENIRAARDLIFEGVSYFHFDVAAGKDLLQNLGGYLHTCEEFPLLETFRSLYGRLADIHPSFAFASRGELDEAAFRVFRSKVFKVYSEIRMLEGFLTDVKSVSVSTALGFRGKEYHHTVVIDAFLAKPKEVGLASTQGFIEDLLSSYYPDGVPESPVQVLRAEDYDWEATAER